MYCSKAFYCPILKGNVHFHSFTVFFCVRTCIPIQTFVYLISYRYFVQCLELSTYYIGKWSRFYPNFKFIYFTETHLYYTKCVDIFRTFLQKCKLWFHAPFCFILFPFLHACAFILAQTRDLIVFMFIFRVHFLHCYNKRKEMFSHYHKIILPHGQLLPHTFYEYCTCPITIHSIHSFLKLINMLYQLYWLIKRKKIWLVKDFSN